MEFIADTNIVIRLLTNDDEKQVSEIVDLINDGHRLWLTSAVVIECCWVLKSYYRFDHYSIANALFQFINSDEVHVEEEFITSVLDKYGIHNLDIVDVYLSVKSKHMKAPVLTWDKGFKNLDCEWFTPGK